MKKDKLFAKFEVEQLKSTQLKSVVGGVWQKSQCTEYYGDGTSYVEVDWSDGGVSQETDCLT